MRTADALLDAACNWASDRPWFLCWIICAAILIGAAVDGGSTP
jgi:hypothetical protein